MSARSTSGSTVSSNPTRPGRLGRPAARRASRLARISALTGRKVAPVERSSPRVVGAGGGVVGAAVTPAVSVTSATVRRRGRVRAPVSGTACEDLRRARSRRARLRGDPAQLCRRGGGGRSARRRRPAYPAGAFPGAGRAGGRPRLAQVREPAAHRFVQDPRRLHPDRPADRGRAVAGGRGRQRRQPRAGRRPRRSPARHPGHRLHARDGATAEGRGHPRLRGGDPAARPDARRAAGGGRRARRADRFGVHPPLRSPRRHRRAGHRRPRGPGAVPGGGDRRRLRRRRGPGVGDRRGGEGTSSRRAGGGGAGRGCRGVSRFPRRRTSGAAAEHGHDGRRHRRGRPGRPHPRARAGSGRRGAHGDRGGPLASAAVLPRARQARRGTGRCGGCCRRPGRSHLLRPPGGRRRLRRQHRPGPAPQGGPARHGGRRPLSVPAAPGARPAGFPGGGAGGARRRRRQRAGGRARADGDPAGPGRGRGVRRPGDARARPCRGGRLRVVARRVRSHPRVIGGPRRRTDESATDLWSLSSSTSASGEASRAKERRGAERREHSGTPAAKSIREPSVLRPSVAVMTDAIVVEGLVKRFGATTALDGVDFTVAEGSVLGLLGPNGAGKTTVVRILTTLLVADTGSAEVVGLDVVRDADAVRASIGLTGQYAAVDEYLTGSENLEMVGRLYHLSKAQARERAGELLDRFDLTDAADRPAKTYSGGMRRRLDIAASLIARPRVLFLDEPTTGLDPRSRLAMWEFIADLADGGTTILLTTQYLEEADRLADRMVVIDRGRVIARGTGDELKAQVGGQRLEFTFARPIDVAEAAARLRGLSADEVQADEQTRRLSLPVRGGTDVLAAALHRLDGSGVDLLDVGLRRPDLDDVFLTLTGHAAAQDADAEPEPSADGRAPAETAGSPR